ncbi:type IV pilus modification protein PilV [Derxia lacustris]|uniref:type IV pilus modification protein PilV n=1 Tax=Derxia lacustris TaxID=764842 RepID=UPI000A1707B9|nr:type IV pilus modification protein PilV [Derxia lacustris]
MRLPSSGSGAAGRRGFSLIEVLIVLVVVSLGLIGLAGLQVNAMSYSKTAVSRSASAALAYDMADRIRGNLNGLINGRYVLDQTWSGSSAVPELPSCYNASRGITSGNCNAAQIAAIDLNRWSALVADQLPSGRARIEALDGSGKSAKFQFGVRIIIGYAERNSAMNPLGNDSEHAATNCPSSFTTDTSVQCFQLDVAP